MRTVFADLLLVGGFASIAYGVGLLWLPAGFVVGGAALVVLGLVAARKPAVLS
jgi:hypothetical protein